MLWLWTILLIIFALWIVRTSVSVVLRKKWGKHDPTNEESVEGKVVVITGANSGIGKVTAQELASRGATVILACRNTVAAVNAVCDIRLKTNKGNLVVMELDLASLESVRSFASDFRKRFPELHILINNGGILTPSRHHTKSADGYEIHFATNHLGHFLLTNLLLDPLKAGAPSRIVTVTSHIHVKGEIDFDDLMGERKNYVDDLTKIQFPLYANSKLANALFSQELGRRLAGTKITSYALCPGDVVTNISRTLDISIFIRVMYVFLGFLHKTPEEGAQTTLHCALSRDISSETGQMYRNCAFWPPTERIPLDDAVAKRLWTESARVVGLEE